MTRILATTAGFIAPISRGGTVYSRSGSVTEHRELRQDETKNDQP